MPRDSTYPIFNLRCRVPTAILILGFRIRDLKYWVLGPSGLMPCQQVYKRKGKRKRRAECQSRRAADSRNFGRDHRSPNLKHSLVLMFLEIARMLRGPNDFEAHVLPKVGRPAAGFTWRGSWRGLQWVCRGGLWLCKKGSLAFSLEGLTLQSAVLSRAQELQHGVVYLEVMWPGSVPCLSTKIMGSPHILGSTIHRDWFWSQSYGSQGVCQMILRRVPDLDKSFLQRPNHHQANLSLVLAANFWRFSLAC